MPTLIEIFKKQNIVLYQNESLDLDHHYQEPYQDEGEEIAGMNEPFETDKSPKIRKVSQFDTTFSHLRYFMDGSRRTYKIGDIVINGRRIFPIIVAQIRAGCANRNTDKKLSTHELAGKNLLLICDSISDADYDEIKARIMRSGWAITINLEVVPYRFDPSKDIIPVNAAIAKANSLMHEMEISILTNMVRSDLLTPTSMLAVDGPLQFIRQDRGTSQFADLFYNVIGISKSFDPMLPISGRTRGSPHIGVELTKLEHGQRTPVFLKINSKGRRFGCWYLRIRPKARMSNPLEGIIKIEKMANEEDIQAEGLSSQVVDNLSLSLLNECSPSCHGRDERWANHLYPIYLTEALIKSSFQSDLVFISNFKRNF
jgi:hypothetical protein